MKISSLDIYFGIRKGNGLMPSRSFKDHKKERNKRIGRKKVEKGVDFL